MKNKINSKLKPVLNVAGNGLWSDRNTTLPVSKMEVQYWVDSTKLEYNTDIFIYDKNGFPRFGELRVFFHKKSWDPEKHGLIYTDTVFLKELKNYFKKIKLEGKVDYSEQGMQGDNYVSLDVDKKFMLSWIKKKFKTVLKVY